MKWLAVLSLTAIAACGSLTEQAGGVVALEVTGISAPTLAVGHSLTLHARALDIQGDSVAADLFWRTPDTALVTLDTVGGVVVARTSSGIARVQARVGTLLSNVISITLRDSTTSVRAPR